MGFTADIRHACKFELNTGLIKYMLETDFDLEMTDDALWTLAETVTQKMEHIIANKIAMFENINMVEIFSEAVNG